MSSNGMGLKRGIKNCIFLHHFISDTQRPPFTVCLSRGKAEKCSHKDKFPIRNLTTQIWISNFKLSQSQMRARRLHVTKDGVILLYCASWEIWVSLHYLDLYNMPREGSYQGRFQASVAYKCWLLRNNPLPVKYKNMPDFITIVFDYLINYEPTIYF